ncbi:MAG TPA: tRNA lysidine(34) synthetase TilS [Opitutus sp.]|nr:tRNA lysidine(34) synthetase TilS [Opitutus sp.]
MGTRTRIDWRQCAERLAAAVPRERLHPAVLAWAEQSRANEPWVAAFSGGADSLAMLLLLWAHWPERRKRLAAVHFNHRLRGLAAEADEKFCATVCRALRIRLRAGKWKRRTAARAPSEAEAREVRHEFFGVELQRLRARALWFGHQQDDVAETMLMRLARGSGTGGLAAPRPVQRMPDGRVHLRPLLALKKREIAAALKRAGATWCEDATNARPDYLRNRVRHAVLPAWRRATGDRDALAGAAWSRELLEDDDAALEHWLAELAPVGKDGSLSLRRLAGKPRGLVRRALREWLARNRVGAGLSRQALETLLQDVMRGRRTRHSVGATALAEIGRVRAVIVRSGGKMRRGFHRRLN